ncbi:hypothetical protein [Stutzerimonas tarimensis]|uniref:Uncharacterized protein n=1 Tax=Stutzerimonas tarimensis TaxID=1507735 RepID=A0ABV7T994_9GAMM
MSRPITVAPLTLSLQASPGWLDQQQRWSVPGAGIALSSCMAGLLFSRGQRCRQWLN